LFACKLAALAAANMTKELKITNIPAMPTITAETTAETFPFPVSVRAIFTPDEAFLLTA
jgi:hypothetical protein